MHSTTYFSQPAPRLSSGRISLTGSHLPRSNVSPEGHRRTAPPIISHQRVHRHQLPRPDRLELPCTEGPLQPSYTQSREALPPRPPRPRCHLDCCVAQAKSRQLFPRYSAELRPAAGALFQLGSGDAHLHTGGVFPEVRRASSSLSLVGRSLPGSAAAEAEVEAQAQGEAAEEALAAGEKEEKGADEAAHEGVEATQQSGVPPWVLAHKNSEL